MKLSRFRVYNFRSIMDSGWIESSDVTALVGVNESGKSNVLVALWKLKPARDGDIDLIADLPRSKYTEQRELKDKPNFIEAEFILDDKTIEMISEIVDYVPEELEVVNIKRNFGKVYEINFPGCETIGIEKFKIDNILNSAQKKLTSLKEEGVSEKGIKKDFESVLVKTLKSIENLESLDITQLEKIVEELSFKYRKIKKSTIRPLIEDTITNIEAYLEILQQKPIHTIEEIKNLIIDRMPSFVYYTQYGNLDSEIYLPHVIANMDRKDLSGKIEAQTRTLKVLFEFVKLNAKEILDLADETPLEDVDASEEEREKIAAQKTERLILLQSAATKLTKEFRDWWKQGNYIFDFSADGKHFRILVSDDKRPEKIHLESRSTGLQWFLSFFLVFLVERGDAHQNTILLLDEAGQSLHPLAQKDLISFFDSLAKDNQIIYTTHSPFLIDSNNVDQVRVVYIDSQGNSVVSSNLRASADQNIEQSVYAVHAALGLSISDVLLHGCQPVIVEGPSDQFYLTFIKNYLIRKNAISPEKDILFMPAGGVRGVESISGILAGKSEELPYIMLDSDKAGLDYRNKLVKRLYKDSESKIICISDIVKID